MPGYLFREEDLDAKLESGHKGSARLVDEISEDQFIGSSDDEIARYVLSQFELEPLALRENEARLEQCEKQIDVSRDPIRSFMAAGPHYVPGTEVTIQIPFEGHSWLWGYKTNPWSDYPSGTIVSPRGAEPGVLVLEIHLPHDADPAEFKRIRDGKMELIRECLKRSSDQITKYNSSLDRIIRNAIVDRRTRLRKHADLSRLLDIPLKEKAGAPSLEKIPLKIKNRTPLPALLTDGIPAEPGIDADSYEHILKIVRHEGRTFEAAPATFAKHDEEGLRDIIVAHLNGHFEGGVTGETFRRKGKTDIRIEQRDRSAFVAECKIWRGQEGVKKSVDQLLGYLTWRDSKAALIIFNTEVAQFSDLIVKLRDALSSHPLLVSEMKCGHEGEYRVMMRSAEDEGRRVMLHAFLFNLYL